MAYPFDDEYMVYDLERQMYVLTNKAVKDYIGEDLVTLAGTEVKADIVRYEVSEDIYNYISRYTLNMCYKYKVWLIAKDNELRQKFFHVLLDQMRYYIRSGAGLIKDMHGVNITNGKVINLNDLRNDVLVSASVETKLKNSGLLYSGRLYYSLYSEDGTW